MTTQGVRPSRLGYWLAALLLAGAVVGIGFAVAGFFALDRQVSGFQRVPVPGASEVTFEERGDYVLYLEGPGVSDEGSTASAQVLLEPADGGSPVPIRDYRASLNYTLGGHEGTSAGTFTIDQPGRYLLSTEAGDGTAVENVAVGRSIGLGILRPVLLLLGSVLGLIPAAIVLGIVTGVRRHRARRAHTPMPNSQPGTTSAPHLT